VLWQDFYNANEFDQYNDMEMIKKIEPIHSDSWSSMSKKIKNSKSAVMRSISGLPEIFVSWAHSCLS
jgi:hypothetical protein